MPIKNVNVRPGVVREGTPYSAKGRWYETSLVRWKDGLLRAIGGWVRRQDNTYTDIASFTPTPATDTVRDLLAYTDNLGGLQIAVGSNSALSNVNSSGLVTDITPAGFVPGLNVVIDLIGYGIGPYGRGTYGTPRSSVDAKPVPVNRWNFDNWGEDLLASFELDTLYEYAPGDPAAIAVGTAPAMIKDFLVTDERIVMAIVYDNNNPRHIQWSDREDYTNWTAAVDNYAGDKTIPGQGYLIGLYKVGDQYLVLSESDAHVGRYVGAPFVYGFKSLGTNCEPIHYKAVAETDRFVIWLGKNVFWMFDGTLRPVQCDITDYIAKTLDTTQASKMNATTISEFSEVWWFYQSIGASDIDTYVVYNYIEQLWYYGKLSRSACIDKGASRSPLMVDTTGILWNHEQLSVTPDGDVYGLTGPMQLEDGDTNLAVAQLFPDTKSKNQVEFEFFTRQNSTDDEDGADNPTVSHGVMEYRDPVPTTGVLGREVLLKIIGLTNEWRYGKIRLNVTRLYGGSR